jgi:transposase
MIWSSRSIAVSGSCGRWVPTIPTTSQLGLLLTVPGIAWVLGYTIAAEIGDIHRFASPQQGGGSGRGPQASRPEPSCGCARVRLRSRARHL